MDSYQGKVLQYLPDDEGFLNEGELVYCFQEDEYNFCVQARRLICGVNQITFSIDLKHKFRIIP
jgi:hypothetical protein